MFILANFLMGLAKVIDIGLNLYLWLVVIRALLSWVNPDPYNPIVRFINRSTEPVLQWVRRRVPVALGGIDLSPLLVILAIYFLREFVVRSLADLAAHIH